MEIKTGQMKPSASSKDYEQQTEIIESEDLLKNSISSGHNLCLKILQGQICIKKFVSKKILRFLVGLSTKKLLSHKNIYLNKYEARNYLCILIDQLLSDIKAYIQFATIEIIKNQATLRNT